MRIERYLIRLYPRFWRRRYEEEVLALLEQRSPSILDGIDLLFGALDAHLHPHLGATGIALCERMRQMLHAIRRSLLMIFSAYAGFIIAGLAFQKMTEYDDFMEAAHVQGVVGLSFTLVVIGSAVALLATLAGGLPIVAAVLKYAFTKKRLGLLFLLAVPILAFVVFINTPVLLSVLFSTNDLSSVLARSAFVVILLAAAIVSTGAVCIAVARSEIGEKLLRFALLAATLATVSMVLMFMATIVWGLGLWSTVPELFTSNEGIFGASTTGTWIGIIVVMAIATLLAAFALLRGFAARSALA
ncbi:MAG: hypothetical protein J2P36_30170 [Ktedonobacteraceae bacterium]|nr:hypothetical protein [Ktedonobacteraceae bacterium]